MAYYSKKWDVKRILDNSNVVLNTQKRSWYYRYSWCKHLSIINDILSKDKVFVTERGSQYFDETQKEMKVALGIISIWRETQEITEEQLDIL
jgi:hypothetical protein